MSWLFRHIQQLQWQAPMVLIQRCDWVLYCAAAADDDELDVASDIDHFHLVWPVNPIKAEEVSLRAKLQSRPCTDHLRKTNFQEKNILNLCFLEQPPDGLVFPSSFVLFSCLAKVPQQTHLRIRNAHRIEQILFVWMMMRPTAHHSPTNKHASPLQLKLYVSRSM